MTSILAPRSTSGLFGRMVVATAAVNVVSLVLGLLTGILLARSLGDSGRGSYATVMAWYGMALVLGEWGQSAALTFRVAQALPASRATAVASSRLVMLVPSVLIAALGISASASLGQGDRLLAWAYTVAFSTVVLNGLLAPFVFAMQAISIRHWNAIRLSQSVVYVVLVAGIAATVHLSVLGATACVASSTAAQLAIAWFVGRRAKLGGARATSSEVRQLASFGTRQAASAVPSSAAASVDKIVLAGNVPSAVVGEYAVAQTVVSTAGALATAVSAVAYPKLAASRVTGSARAAAEAKLVGMAGVGVLVATMALALISRWAIPLVFGEDFVESVALVWWFVPVIVLRTLNLVSGTVLRGRGLPGRAAAAEGVGLVAAFVLLLGLVPQVGAVGAALAMALGGASSFGVAVLLWMERTRSEWRER